MAPACVTRPGGGADGRAAGRPRDRERCGAAAELRRDRQRTRRPLRRREACRDAIAEAEGPVVLCGHSYGGMVITEAGADDRVTQLLYVTSVMPEAGQSQSDLIGSEPAPWLMPGDDGTIGVHPDLIREFFLQDCDESRSSRRSGVSRVSHSRRSRSHPARSPGSRSPPRTSCAPRISPLPPRSSVNA